MEVRTFNVGPLDNNTYLIVDPGSRQAAVVDPGFGSESVLAVILGEGLKLTYVLNTHAHLDHVAQNARFVRDLGATLGLHAADRPLLDALAQQAAWFGVEMPDTVQPALDLDDGMSLRLGASVVTVVHTPGHSPGHVCFEVGVQLIVGDVVFAGSIGRTDLPGGDHPALMRSIWERIMTRPPETQLLPGHGPATTVAQERRTNPFLTGGPGPWLS